MSINDLLRRPTRKPVYVQPGEWTSEHLELLRCHFDWEDPAGVATSCDADSQHEPEDPGDQFAHHAKQLSIGEKIPRSFGFLLTGYHRPLVQFFWDAKFVFAGRHSFRVPCQALCIRPPSHATALASHRSPPTPPTFGYIVAAHITQARREIFYPERRRRTRELERGRAVRMGLATPSDPFRDPYIVVSLIALAQEQARFALEDSPGSELSGARKFPVRVFMISPHDTNAMRLYTAEIPAAFLKMIEDPSAPLAEPLRIKARAVPYRPYATLATRLWDEVQALPPAESAERERVIRDYEEGERRLAEENRKRIMGEVADAGENETSQGEEMRDVEMMG